MVVARPGGGEGRSRKLSKFAIFFPGGCNWLRERRQWDAMKDARALDLAGLWALARSGNFRAGAEDARRKLRELSARASADRVELRLVAAFCAMRQGHHVDALQELDAAAEDAARLPSATQRLHVDTWRAELAYFQGRYSAAEKALDDVLPALRRRRDWSYVSFALRIRIAILLARADYDAIAAIADDALAAAEASGDDYVLVQVLNILGAFHFDVATSRLAEPHARAHLPLVDTRDIGAIERDAREALRYFERAREAAERGRHAFAAWYVAGNIERLQILLGQARRAVPAIRKRLKALQQRGATYDEIVTRSNLAWGLRCLGRHREALHELDVALDLARRTGTFNVLLEFLHYDRSIVLDALGDHTGARASYRRYVALVTASRVEAGSAERLQVPPVPAKRPLEPFFLKRADRIIAERLAQKVSIRQLAAECGVSWRTLQNAFLEFRGLTPVAHIRNLRLDRARAVLGANGASIAEAAASCGFRSATTFALEYRRRFGVAPSRDRDRNMDGKATAR